MYLKKSVVDCVSISFLVKSKIWEGQSNKQPCIKWCADSCHEKHSLFQTETNKTWHDRFDVDTQNHDYMLFTALFRHRKGGVKNSFKSIFRRYGTHIIGSLA